MNEEARALDSLSRPIGVFDAGIGSYAVVERIRSQFPQQDLVYLADRASFPYGSKSPEALLAVVTCAAQHLIALGCPAVVLASNAPSIVVLDLLRQKISCPVVGVFPPVQEALRASRTGAVAVLGVKSMVDSPALNAYVAQQCAETGRVALCNASSMVDLVEHFHFLSEPQRTQRAVDDFVAQILRQNPDVDVMTLSSTHLPWLRPFFERAAPQVQFLDPADTVLAQILPYVCVGQGQTVCQVTVSEACPAAPFEEALVRLGAPFKAQVIPALSTPG